MSQIEVDKIIPQSGTSTQLGESGDTITVPSGATLDASNATTTLPSTVVTTTGTQTLTNKSIVTTQLTGTISTSQIADDAVTLAKMAPGTDGNIISYDASGNPVAVATGSAGQVLTSAGAGAPPTFATPAAGGGITEADMFRLTANTSGGTNAVISANLERVDDASFSKIGTGMTESSGQFAFPSTGLYHVIANPMIRSDQDGNSYVRIELSTDSGSNFTDTLAFTNGGAGGGGNTTLSVYQSSFVNVTNATTFRIHFKTSSMSAGSLIEGNTDANYTTFKFIRLGDSQ